MARIQERYRRVDQYNLQLTVTVDDPKFYTKPWTFMRANLYWMKAQKFAETLCVPSEALEYRDSLASHPGSTSSRSRTMGGRLRHVGKQETHRGGHHRDP